MADKEKTTLSVPEMRRLLGLGKTEGYWLIHKKYFDTVELNGRIRVVRKSFEEWYSHQDRYVKADGTVPGEKLRQQFLSTGDIAEMLGLTKSNAQDLIHRKHFQTFMVEGKPRVPRILFDQWYASQSHYRTIEDRQRDREAEENSYSMPEIARMLCVDRNTIYSIAGSRAGLEIVLVGNQKRITKQIFESWYINQSKYTKLIELSPEERKEAMEKLRAKERKRRPPKAKNQVKSLQGKAFYTVHEAAVMLGVSDKSLYRMIDRGDITAKGTKGQYRIMQDEIKWWQYRNHQNAEEE